MFKYHFTYKYFKVKLNRTIMFVGVTCDNEFGETCYSAVSNLLFRDEYGDWGHAVGVGDTEQAAWNMFWKDLQQYFPDVDCEKHKCDIEEITFPQRVLICKGNAILLAHDDGNGTKTILTKNGMEKAFTDDLVKYIADNRRKYRRLSISEDDYDFLKRYDFFPTFRSTCKEFGKKKMGKVYLKEIKMSNYSIYRQFAIAGTYATFEPYAMSELLSPIEDYLNFLKLVQENYNLLQGYNLVYIAAYLNSLWHAGNKFFIDALNETEASMSFENKSIVYYLNALEIRSNEPRNMSEYKNFLEKSVECSQAIKFVNNRLDLANILKGKAARDLMEEAVKNISEVLSDKHIAERDIQYWLSSQYYIDEFILGTVVSAKKFNEMQKFSAL